MINPWRTITHLAFPVTDGFGKAKLLMGSDRIDVALPPCDEEAVAMGGLVDTFAVASLTRTLRPKVCFEIGTYLGRSTLAMALSSRDDCVIHTLDQADGPRVGSAFRGRPEARKIRQLFGDSTEFSFAPYAGKVDFVLVDGGHEYDAASKDTENAFRILSPRGMISVARFLTRLAGVVKALEKSGRWSEIRRLTGTGYAIYANSAFQRRQAA